MTDRDEDALRRVPEDKQPERGGEPLDRRDTR